MNLNRIFAGIDPGIKGAIAVETIQSIEDELSINIINIYDIPSKNNEIDINKLNKIISDINKTYKPIFVLEKIHSLPRDGHVGAFKFGYIYGVIKTILTVNNTEFYEISPVAWKRYARVNKFKESSIERVKEYISQEQFNKYYTKKIHHNRMEAVLIPLGFVKYYLTKNN